VKDAFDPPPPRCRIGLLNPNRIVHPPRMDDRTLFRYGPDYAADPKVTPALDWSAWSGHRGTTRAACWAPSRCATTTAPAGNSTPAACAPLPRHAAGQHLTRGRANTLRLALTGQLGAEGLASDEVAEALALCVGCKACRRECPTGVDMAKMKIEAAHARGRARGVALKDRLIATMPRWAPLAARAPALFNLRDMIPGAARLTQGLTGLAAGRTLPRFRA
jgi:ferredoxin